MGIRGFAQELAKVDVLGKGSIDTIVVSSILKVTDPAVKSLLDSIVQGEKNGGYYKDLSCYNIIFGWKKNANEIIICIEASDFRDFSDLWSFEFPNYYGSMCYNDRLFMIYRNEASLFFKKTKKKQNLNIRYSPINESSFLITKEPLMWWYFYYKNNKWYCYDDEKHKWMYYNYKERKWVDSE